MEAFEDIYAKYFGDVYRYLRRLTGDEALAEDVTSESFFKALRAIDTFRGDCDLRVWLIGIAKNCYYSRLRKEKRTEPLDEAAEVPSTEEPVEDTVVRREEATTVRRHLHDLPEPYKEVFLWRVFGELSFREIGQLFGKSENWACVTFHRARTMIKRRMEETEHGA